VLARNDLGRPFSRKHIGRFLLRRIIPTGLYQCPSNWIYCFRPQLRGFHDNRDGTWELKWPQTPTANSHRASRRIPIHKVTFCKDGRQKQTRKAGAPCWLGAMTVSRKSLGRPCLLPLGRASCDKSSAAQRKRKRNNKQHRRDDDESSTNRQEQEARLWVCTSFAYCGKFRLA
jgi:hypothetical protein